MMAKDGIDQFIKDENKPILSSQDPMRDPSLRDPIDIVSKESSNKDNTDLNSFDLSEVINEEDSPSMEEISIIKEVP